MGMERWDEECFLLIERYRAGRLSLPFVVQQSCRPIGSLGCVGCCIALCLSSQRNAIGFPARCVCHRSLSRLSSQPVAFIIAVCFVWCCFFLRCFLLLLSYGSFPLSARLCRNVIELRFALCAAGCFVIV